jgi:TonB family protein
MLKFLLAITMLTVLTLAPAGAAQQTRSTIGPVVNAYLTGLAEELNELDFQLRHGEISRSTYDRVYQRLTILQRVVERLAAERREDRVPELEVVTAGEFSRLALSDKMDPATLRVGAVLNERWKLISIEPSSPRFFIFEKIAGRNSSASGKSGAPHPREVIETVIVYEDAPQRAAPRPTPAAPERAANTAPPAESPPALPPAPVISGPRILSFYLPGYTAEARKRGIEGEVVLSALFQRGGKLKEVRIERGLGYGLDERALEAAKRTRFEAARRDGQPVDARAQVVYTFKLDRVTAQVRAAKLEDEVSKPKP